MSAAGWMSGVILARQTWTTNIVQGTRSQLIAWIVLNMWPSHLGLPVLLAVIMFANVKRGPTFVNMLVTWIIAGFSASLLVYTGNVTGPEPNKALCLAHASLVYGIPPMTCLSTFFLVLQMFLTIRTSYYGEDRNKYRVRHRVHVCMMIIFPYLAFVIVSIATALVGSHDLRTVSRDRRFFYCSVKSNLLTNALSLFAGLVLSSTLAVEVWTVVFLYRHRISLQVNRKMLFTAKFNLTLRIMAFGMCVFVAGVLSFVSMKAPRSPAPDLIIAFAATVVIAIFGTQLDILKALCFWRNKPHTEQQSPHFNIEQPTTGIVPEWSP